MERKLKFDLDDAVKLLMGKRDEKFPHERVIRLFQLQTWIWYPNSSKSAEHAAQLAATTILRDLESEKFPSGRFLRSKITMGRLHTLSESDEYRKLFDSLIAPGPGWSSIVMDSVRPETFDQRIAQRSAYGPMIAELIDYRLRAVLNGRNDEANISHAIFFNWWPSKKKPSPRTRFAWWKWLKRTSAFIYLIEKHGYAMKPPELNDDDFFESLLNPAISPKKLLRFFSKYAFIIDTLKDKGLVSISAKPSPIAVKPFSKDEIAAIGAYKEHHFEMNEGTNAQTSAGESLDEATISKQIPNGTNPLQSGYPRAR
jgi:hypothetical protein